MEPMTVDELSHRSGVPTSTIRMYQSRKLLDGPQRQGRQGFYSDQHLDRLKTIARLQESGFSLAGIAELLNAQKQGHGLGAVLGMPAGSGPLRLPVDELADKFAGQEMPQETLERAMNLGLLEFDADVVVIPEPEFLEMGSRLSELGVDVDAVLDEYEALRAETDVIAERFIALFENSLWQSAEESGDLEQKLPQLADALKELGPLAERIVTSVLRRSLETGAQRFAHKQQAAIARAGMSDTFNALFTER